MDRIFCEENVRISVDNLLKKSDSCGIDGVFVSQYEEYWKLNKEKILGEIIQGVYEPEPVQMVEIIDKKGKRREISKYTCTDRIILDVLKRELDLVYSEKFSCNSYAYQKDKGVQAAVARAAKYIEDNDWVVEVDIKNFFDTINIHRLLKMLRKEGIEDYLLDLIKKYLFCKVYNDYVRCDKVRGIIQGSPISPILSNIYMMPLDEYLSSKYQYCRFSDDINVYCKSRDKAMEIMIDVRGFLLKKLGLNINMNKSGIYMSLNRKYLGYEFCKKSNGNAVYVRKANLHKKEYLKNWKSSAIQKIDRNYHLVNDGILTRKDYTILFENSDGKKYIPVEMCDSINIYSNIAFGSGFFEFANDKKLQINMFGKYGQYIGSFYTGSHYAATKIMLKQAQLYNSEKDRLIIGKEIEIASLHNQRENLRYFYKRKRNDEIAQAINDITLAIDNIKQCETIEELMLYEARGKQKYFQMFDLLISNNEFSFVKRTKQPPENEVNALMSFGNVFLYQRIANKIRKTPLDIRIGFVYASNSRKETLNLDIAEIFKPIIVDKAIFTLLNRHELDKDRHFIKGDNAVLLSVEGKRVFIEKLEGNLYRKITVKEMSMTYDKLIDIEITKIIAMVKGEERYKAYKHT